MSQQATRELSLFLRDLFREMRVAEEENYNIRIKEISKRSGKRGKFREEKKRGREV